MKRLFAAVLMILIGSVPAQAHQEAKMIEYEHEGALLEGFLVYDSHAEAGSLPGVLIVHEWKGFGDYVKRRAEQVAKLGYAVFALDMYGKGIYAKDHVEAAELSGLFREDRAWMRARAHAGLEVLTSQEVVDSSRLAAIGYCFGGTTVLEMARSGEPFAGVATFHAGLSSPHTEDAANIAGRVIVFHGADDPHVGQDQVEAFQREMDAAEVDYELIQYPGAMHSFTVKEAGDDPSTGMAYSAEADQESWMALEGFLAEVLEGSSD